MRPALLTVSGLTMRFGGLVVMEGVSFTANEQQITAVIGPNGAGKTTLFNCLTGFYKPSCGTIQVFRNGRSYDCTRLSAQAIVRKVGVARTFQNIRLFPGLTVLENLLVAQHGVFGWIGLTGGVGAARTQRAAVAKALEWLDYFGLADAADREAGILSYGQQRAVEIARALCLDPVLLCLDEPAAGLNPAESQGLMHLLARLRDQRGISMVLIEHDMPVVMGISDTVVVLEYGRVLAQGTPGEVRRNPEVIRAYLGEAA